ncbi:MAG: glycosyltransferase family 4 protein [bacterium]|nr:glycosyltransferase family 4 protein [bacterium]
MKIAMICDIEEPVPPRKYGGSEWVVYNLATGLGKAGHQVDVYATGDSQKSPCYNLIPIVEKSIRTIPEFEKMYHRELPKFDSLVKAITMINEQKYDIVHDQGYWRLLSLSPFVKAPIVKTHHYPLSDFFMNYATRMHPSLTHVSISNNQRKALPNIPWAATIYHGIDIDAFKPVENDDGYMLYLARMCDDKGGIEAAKVAHELKLKLKVCAKVDDVDKAYYEQFKPYIDTKYVEFIGEVSLEEKINYLSHARLLLAPIKWEEPFGLNFVEAIASGIPVVPFARGSIPELIEDGKTGYIVNQSEELNRGNWITKSTYLDGLKEAVTKIYSMPKDEYVNMKKVCRSEAEKRFSIKKMVDEYVGIYNKIYK